MAKVTLIRDFQYDVPGDSRMYAAGPRELAEPYLSAAIAAGVVAAAPSKASGLRRPRLAKPAAKKAGS